MTRPELFADEMPVNRHLFQTKSLQLFMRDVILLFVLLVSRVFANTRRAELVIEKYHQSHFPVRLLNDTPGNVDYTLYRK